MNATELSRPWRNAKQQNATLKPQAAHATQHINKANKALAEEDDTAPPTTKKPRHDAAATQPKKDAR